MALLARYINTRGRNGSDVHLAPVPLLCSCISCSKKYSCITGVTVSEINTRTFCASQYDHVENKNKKTPLSQRTKIIGVVKVQRDLYSAFLISNATNDLSHANRRKCNKKFADFIVMQEKEITRMKASGSSMKQCFGF